MDTMRIEEMNGERIEEMANELNQEYHQGDFAEPPFYDGQNIDALIEEKQARAVVNTSLVESPKLETTTKENKMKEEQMKDNIYFLKKPFHFEQEYVDHVRIDIDSLTGRDLMQAARDSKSPSTTVVEYDKEYLAHVACIAMGRPYEFMEYIGAKDFTEITAKVLTFFLL